MKNYRYEKVEESVYAIIEIPTDVTILYETEKEAAKERCKALNGDQGFQGWTPSFMISRRKV